jgi:hypothetical protein
MRAEVAASVLGRELPARRFSMFLKGCLHGRRRHPQFMRAQRVEKADGEIQAAAARARQKTAGGLDGQGTRRIFEELR